MPGGLPEPLRVFASHVSHRQILLCGQNPLPSTTAGSLPPSEGRVKGFLSLVSQVGRFYPAVTTFLAQGHEGSCGAQVAFGRLWRRRTSLAARTTSATSSSVIAGKTGRLTTVCPARLAAGKSSARRRYFSR